MEYKHGVFKMVGKNQIKSDAGIHRRKMVGIIHPMFRNVFSTSLSSRCFSVIKVSFTAEFNMFMFLIVIQHPILTGSRSDQLNLAVTTPKMNNICFFRRFRIYKLGENIESTQ